MSEDWLDRLIRSSSMSEDWLNRLIPKHPLWFVWVGGSVLLFWIIFWWSVGMFPTNAFGNGFARTEDSKLNTQLILEMRLFEMKKQQCTANDNTSIQYFTLEINRLMDLYESKIGRRYNEPPCSAVTVTVNPAG